MRVKHLITPIQNTIESFERLYVSRLGRSALILQGKGLRGKGKEKNQRHGCLEFNLRLCTFEGGNLKKIEL